MLLNELGGAVWITILIPTAIAMNKKLSFFSCLLAALLIASSVGHLYSQEDSLITQLDVVGNIEAHIMPGQRVRIVTTAEAGGTGKLELRIRGFEPPFLSGWDSKSVDCLTQCQLVDTLFIEPTRTHYGEYSFTVFAEFFVDNELVEQKNRRIRVKVSPIMIAESPFTKGASNQLCWQPHEDTFNYELIRVFTSHTNKQAQRDKGESNFALAIPGSCDVVENLPEGPRFGYYVLAKPPDTNISFRSDVVYSIQDQTTPPAIEIENFSVRANATVALSWQSDPDAISYTDSYIIHRKQVNSGATFTPVDTISVFPVKVAEPLNYYPAAATLDQSVYVDTADSIFVAEVGQSFTIQHLPNELLGSALIKTAIRDRWNESERAIVLELNTASEIFIAYDVDNRNEFQPDWLDEQFSPIAKSLDITDGKLRIYRSNQPYPVGQVVLGGNFANGAQLRNKVPMMYLVFIKPVEKILPFATGAWVNYVDSLGTENDLNTYKYKISAVDAVGNKSTGPESPPIILDLNGQCKPIVTKWFVYENANQVRFGSGRSNTICILDPKEDPNCQGFRDSDSLQFQAARESLQLFDSNSEPDQNVRFFDSGWQSTTELDPAFCYRFSFINEQNDPNFVNGKTYYYRVRTKDGFGNIGEWSDTLSAIQDAFPPDDVSSLSVESDRFSNGESGCNRLTWTGAHDLVSGVKSFIIYRTDVSSPQDFAAIDTIAGTENVYCDSLGHFSINKVVTYKIGSIDNVGNIRTANESNKKATIRALLGPTLAVDSSQVFGCPTGLTRVVGDSIAISWKGFDNTDVSGYDVEIQQPDGFTNRKIFGDPALAHISCPLIPGDGIYAIRMRAFYANRDTTLFSNTISVRRKQKLGSVKKLSATQDPLPTGNIRLSWTHADLGEIEEFQIFSWQEGEEKPTEPTATLPGEQAEWVHDFYRDKLTAYRCNYYAVRAIDCFGLISAMDTVVSAYSNKPPAFLDTATEISMDRIKVCWSRPLPQVKPNLAFESSIVVYQDSLASQPFESVSFLNDTCFVLHNPIPDHNYIFKVKEKILDDLEQACSDKFESNFSSTITLPFENPPASVDFDVQPLPVHPDSLNGAVFLSWQMFMDPAVTHFVLQYNSPGPGETILDSVLVKADTLLVTGLDIHRSYAFKLISVDSLGQRSVPGPAIKAEFLPRWLFTPQITALSPGCFRDSVTISWAWLNESLEVTPENFGADSIFIELSIDSTFSLKKSTKSLTATQSHTFFRDKDFAFVNNQNDQIYVRIKAKDRWGHFSPWSSTYTELGIFSGFYDEIAPAIVAAAIDSVKAPLFGGPNEVDVHMHWQEVADQCSGTAFYEITRNDSIVATQAGGNDLHSFADRGLQSGSSLLAQTWRIFAVDSVGNRQPTANEISVPLTITAPDSGWCQDDTTFCWNSAFASLPGFEPAYSVEGARFPSLLGNPLTNLTGVNLTTQCFNFKSPWESIYWRVKARISTFESAWSDTFFCNLNDSGTVTSVDAVKPLPPQYALNENYPNPFNPTTTIRYDIPELKKKSTQVTLEIFNVKGQLIRILVNKKQRPGHHSVDWDGRNDAGNIVASGVYVYRIQAQNFVSSHKMTFIK